MLLNFSISVNVYKYDSYTLQHSSLISKKLLIVNMVQHTIPKMQPYINRPQYFIKWVISPQATPLI